MIKDKRKQRKRFWSLIRLTIFLLLVTSASVFAVNRLFQNDKPEEEDIITIQQGIITVINLDAETDAPIINAEFKITSVETGEAVGALATNKEGKAISEPLDYNTEYLIEQVNVPLPYELNPGAINVLVNEENHEIFVKKNSFYSHVKETQKLEDGTVKITKTYMPVEVLLQNPELPNGCEITAVTALLNYYGYGAEKEDMADNYLPKEAFNRNEGKLIGANPYMAFAGNPRDNSGFFSYAPPVVEAANSYIAKAGGGHKAIDVSNSTMEEILQYIDRGLPVVAWVTLDLSKPRINYSWYRSDTDEKFEAPVNLHAVVLKGYDEKNVYYMDPILGDLTKDMAGFFRSYYDLGKHAIVVDVK